MQTTFKEPEDNRRPDLSQETIRGTTTPMESTDAKTYAVSDSFHLSWLRNKLREDRDFRVIRDHVAGGELSEELSRYVTQYMSYLLHNEHNVVLEDAIETVYSTDANFTRDELYVTLKATI